MEENQTFITFIKSEPKNINICSYCTSQNGEGTDIFNGDKLNVGYGVYRKINYCPMCGRKLGDKNNNGYILN